MILKRGKSWRVVVYAGRDPLTGRKRQKTGTAATRAEAKQLEARLITEVGAGQHKAGSTKTIAELLEHWFEWRQGVRTISPKTVESYQHCIDSLIVPALGKLPVRRLDAGMLDGFYAQLRRRGGKDGTPLSASRVRDVHAVMSGALKQAVVWGWRADNPAKLATPPAVEKAKVKPPEVSDATRLLTVAMDEDPELGLFLRLAVILGARRGELCALRWSDVDFERGEIVIAGNVIYVAGQPLIDKDTKTHAERRVAVGAGTLDLLRAHRANAARVALSAGASLGSDAYVFSHEADGSKPIRPDGVSHRFTNLARRLSVRCRLHDLRHFMVTQLIAEGSTGGLYPVVLATRTAT